MKITTVNGVPVAVFDKGTIISNSQDALDLMASARYEGGCERMIVRKESLKEDFFDLKTGLAGEVLQKFSNYCFKLAIVGDFSVYTSKSLRDFIYESNKGCLVFFKGSVDEALAALVPQKTRILIFNYYICELETGRRS